MNKVIVALAVILSALVGACGGHTAQQDVGTVYAKLSLVGGDTLNSVSYTISNAHNNYMGNGDLSAGDSFSVSGINAGDDYTLALTGTTTGGATCSGQSAPFLVQTQLTTTVDVNMACFLPLAPTDGGSVSVVVNAYGCPSVDPIVADSTTVAVGNSVNVAVEATSDDPNDLSYVWSTGSVVDGGFGPDGIGTLGTPSSQNVNTSEVSFKCNEAGTTTVQVSVVDHADGGYLCEVMTSLNITCD